MGGVLLMLLLGWGLFIVVNVGIGFIGGFGGYLINGSNFFDLRVWIDVVILIGIGVLIGVIGGLGVISVVI